MVLLKDCFIKLRRCVNMQCLNNLFHYLKWIVNTILLGDSMFFNFFYHLNLVTRNLVDKMKFHSLSLCLIDLSFSLYFLTLISHIVTFYNVIRFILIGACIKILKEL
ncbi:unnamed protein product [Cuscuta europaea]|uniref:Uncharacterized protein n=1 Tax=Cuscuta europaea TaxID=41803 RepID=A0A9P0YT44_CUSEU|nr:unnamed protein product [Cuscuta europaea]